MRMQKGWRKKLRTFVQGAPIPTSRTLSILGLGLPVFLLWQWKGMLFLDAVILFLCAADFSMTFRKGEIQARRSCPRHFLQGVTQDIEIMVTNEGRRKRHILLRDQPPLMWQAPVLRGEVRGRSSLRLRYQVTPNERGVFTFDSVHLRVRGPAGLVLRPLSVENREEIGVFPHFQPLRYPDLAAYRRRARYWGHRPMKWKGEGREFEALRDYVEGDDLRKIHWKASARLDRPIAQEFQPERNQIIMVFLDMGRLMGAVTEGRSKLDHALEAAVHLTHTALSGGDQVGFLAFADRVVSFVPPKKTRVQLQTILDETVALKPLTVESNYEEAFLWLRSRVRRRSLVVLFTDLLDEIASENLLEAVGLVRPRHLPLCIVIRDGQWDELLARYPFRVEEVYEKSVLQECLRQRRRAMGRLYQKGALALDLAPANLTMETIERYMEVKRKGLL
jgi:uncharacterized protein (DUF58 family)